MMHQFCALLVALGAILPAPPVPGCHWTPQDAPRPAVAVVRHAPAHTRLMWQPGAGVTGVAVAAIRGREQDQLISQEGAAPVEVEDRAAATGYLVYERRGQQVGCYPVPLLPWNWVWVMVVAK